MRPGTTYRLVLRSAVAAADAATPVGAAQAGSVATTGFPAVVDEKVHVTVSISATGAGAQAIVSLFGYNAAANEWYAIAQLNGGSPITATTKTPTAPASNAVFYGEYLDGIVGYDRLYAMITSIAGAGAAVTVTAVVPLV